MTRTYSTYGRDQLSELCHDLITKTWNPEGLLSWLQSQRITREELMDNVLVAGRASPATDSNFQHWKHYPERAYGAIKLYDEMLSHPKFREGAVSFLWANVHENQHQWLNAFCQRMTPESLCNLLLLSPSIASRKRAWRPLDRAIVQFISPQMQEQVMDRANQRRQISKLFNTTGWPGCRELAKGAQRDAVMTIDLGL